MLDLPYLSVRLSVKMSVRAHVTDLSDIRLWGFLLKFVGEFDEK
jgi:hypothetical protein